MQLRGMRCWPYSRVLHVLGALASRAAHNAAVCSLADDKPAALQEQNVQPSVMPTALAAAAALPKAGKPVVPVDADMAREQQLAAMVCSLENKEACMACGS